jgi:hypothetical protein
MIREFKMRPGQIDFGHMTRSAILPPYLADRRCLLLYLMASETLGIIVGSIVFHRFVRIVAGSAAYPFIVRVTFALEDPIRLKSYIVQPIEARFGKYILSAPMTRAAELLSQIITIQPGRVENFILVLYSGSPGSHMFTPGTVTGLTAYPGNHSVQMQLGADYSPGRVTGETLQCFII